MDFNFLKNLSQEKILVAGEVGIDEYIWGDTNRISPEAPVPVVEVTSQELKLGLSANVAQNIATLGGNVTLLTICGEDREATILKDLLIKNGISNFHFIIDSSRPTLKKTRVISQHQHIVRVDFEKSHKLSSDIAVKFKNKLEELLEDHKGVIVQDYGKGIWKSETMEFSKKANKKGIPIFVDPNRNTPLSLYENVTLLTPNILEAKALTHFQPEGSSDSSLPLGNDEKALTQMAKKILETTRCEHAIITCGEWGMVSLSRTENSLVRIPTYAKKVFDVTGAGDTVIAVLSLMSLKGLPLDQSMKVANFAAGIVVGRMGASSVTVEELSTAMQNKIEFTN